LNSVSLQKALPGESKAASRAPGDLLEPQQSKEVAQLGHSLFFDRKLSRDGTVSCADCHRPDHGWSSPDAFSHGVGGQVGKRHAPSLYNVGLQRSFFWDGRARSLEDTVLIPIQDSHEMAQPLAGLLDRLRESNEYRQKFAEARMEIDIAGVSRALAQFCRTIVAEDAPFDRYRAGDMAALSPSARRGHDLFFFRLNCASCHNGKQLSDGKFHNLGIGFEQPKPDLGRYTVTGEKKDRGAFKTPSLRNVAKRSPYMHDGRFKTLEEVIDFYKEGGHANANLDPLINLLPIDDSQKTDVVSFLREGLTSKTDPAAEASRHMK
jgi:cytochrome c peroxidase